MQTGIKSFEYQQKSALSGAFLHEDAAIEASISPDFYAPRFIFHLPHFDESGG
jgi:hypothetical protein